MEVLYLGGSETYTELIVGVEGYAQNFRLNLSPEGGQLEVRVGELNTPLRGWSSIEPRTVLPVSFEEGRKKLRDLVNPD